MHIQQQKKQHKIQSLVFFFKTQAMTNLMKKMTLYLINEITHTPTHYDLFFHYYFCLITQYCIMRFFFKYILTAC